MAKKVFVLPYKAGSASAKVIKDSVKGKLIKLKNSRYRHNPDNQLVVNWGSSKREFLFDNMLNLPEAVALASNKLDALNLLSAAGIPTVEYTAVRDDAIAWRDEGLLVYARTKLRGHSGEGIEVVNDRLQPMPAAPLYTKGITKARKEYRLHVFKGEIILQQQKRRRRELAEAEGVDERIRNLDGGWIFTVNNVEPSRQTQKAAIAAVAALGLDFGAVDIIEVNRGKVPYVLEVNTACGQGGDTTTAAYRTAILRAAGHEVEDIPPMRGEEGEDVMAANPIFFDEMMVAQRGFARGELAMIGAGHVLNEFRNAAGAGGNGGQAAPAAAGGADMAELERRVFADAVRNADIPFVEDFIPDPVPAPAPEVQEVIRTVADVPVGQRNNLRVRLSPDSKWFGVGNSNPSSHLEIGFYDGEGSGVTWDALGHNAGYQLEHLILVDGVVPPVEEEPEEEEAVEHEEIQTGNHYRVRVVHDNNRFAVASVLVPDAVNPLLEALYDDGNTVLVALSELEILGEVEAE